MRAYVQREEARQRGDIGNLGRGVSGDDMRRQRAEEEAAQMRQMVIDMEEGRRRAEEEAARMRSYVAVEEAKNQAMSRIRSALGAFGSAGSVPVTRR
jgi:hypothetical protein